MRIYDLVLFALRALLGHRLRTVLSLIGMAIGVGSVILLTSLGEGAAIRHRAVRFDRLEPHHRLPRP